MATSCGASGSKRLIAMLHIVSYQWIITNECGIQIQFAQFSQIRPAKFENSIHISNLQISCSQQETLVYRFNKD